MKLIQILEKTLPGLGFELVEVEISPLKLIRVYIDKEGGVGVDDCAFVSNHLNRLLAVEEIDYSRLEISSPGLERPLKKLADYIRFRGRLAKIKLHNPIDDNKVFQGHLGEVEENNISLQLENGSQLKVDFNDIYRARLIYEPKKK